MTDVRAAEADPFESSAPEQDEGGPESPDRPVDPADRARRALGRAGWL